MCCMSYNIQYNILSYTVNMRNILHSPLILCLYRLYHICELCRTTKYISRNDMKSGLSKSTHRAVPSILVPKWFLSTRFELLSSPYSSRYIEVVVVVVIKSNLKWKLGFCVERRSAISVCAIGRDTQCEQGFSGDAATPKIRPKCKHGCAFNKVSTSKRISDSIRMTAFRHVCL